MKKQAAYLLPTDLIRDVKRAAADRDIYPAHVVEEALRAHLERRHRTRTRKPARAAAGA